MTTHLLGSNANTLGWLKADVTARTALITGISGQDGSYLAELLLTKGYQVFGLIRDSSRSNLENLSQILSKIELIPGDLEDAKSMESAVLKSRPDEVYHLAARTFVGSSFSAPVSTAEITGMGTIRLLEAVRLHAPGARFYNASTAEMFGQSREDPQDEATPFSPRSPYAVAKVFGFWATNYYRQVCGMHASTGILFNHESPRRKVEMVTRKITRAVAQLSIGGSEKLVLGRLDSRRDWGFAPEYVDLMWRILQLPEPDIFVGATGESHTVREFVEEAFTVAGVSKWEDHVQVDSTQERPADIDSLRGDPSKAKSVLGWEPKVRFKELVKIMIEADLLRANSHQQRKGVPGRPVPG
jgi:GDPmannose 4,6-dehydratase